MVGLTPHFIQKLRRDVRSGTSLQLCGMSKNREIRVIPLNPSSVSLKAWEESPEALLDMGKKALFPMPHARKVPCAVFRGMSLSFAWDLRLVIFFKQIL
jgi:hypothetical protein